ncbi:MAG: hypothetical protein GY749_13870 [Desulfobacteraceae bacterium]|nr:hypothetical protein [Desulfobacteraceae bacterium]
MLYVRLLSFANGEWIHNDYTYNENLPFTTVSITADSSVTDIGGSVTLTWNSSYADSVSVSPGIGDVSLNGSVTVSPTYTTVYTATAEGQYGTASESVTVWITDPALKCSENRGDFNVSVGTGRGCHTFFRRSLFFCHRLV